MLEILQRFTVEREREVCARAFYVQEVFTCWQFLTMIYSLPKISTVIYDVFGLKLFFDCFGIFKAWNWFDLSRDHLDQGTWVSAWEPNKSRVRIFTDLKNLWFDILNLEIDLENRDGSVHQDFKSKIKLTFMVPSLVSFIPDWSRKSLDLVQEKFQFNQNKLGTVG